MFDEVDVPGLKGYTGVDAQRLFAQYESADFDEIHSHWLCYLPPSGARVADIGAGSGRDAAALSDRGFAVTAVEPSLDMITQAKLRHGSSTIEWIQDYLPSLGKLRQERRTFDLLLLSAVWMHLDKREQRYATDTLVT